MIELTDEDEYPFRSSLTKVARCGMCIHNKNEECDVGLTIRYPLITNEHTCPSYIFKEDRIPCPSSPDKIFTFIGEITKLKECDDCVHLFKFRCEGLKGYPISKINGICEFFRHKKLLCKYAVPYLQYGDHIRNNYCSLPPDQRDQNEDVHWDWTWCCGLAHTEDVEELKCYEPIESKKENGCKKTKGKKRIN